MEAILSQDDGIVMDNLLNQEVVIVRKMLYLVLVVMMTVAVAACGEVSTPEKTVPNGDPEEQKPPQQEIFAVGDRVSLGDFFITVKKAYLYAGSEWNKPAEGEKWVVVDVELENGSNESESISSLLMFSLFDSDSYECDIAINIDARGSLDGEIGAGRKMAGELTFSVPEDQTSFEFIFEPNVFGQGQAIYKLENLD